MFLYEKEICQVQCILYAIYILHLKGALCVNCNDKNYQRLMFQIYKYDERMLMEQTGVSYCVTETK